MLSNNTNVLFQRIQMCHIGIIVFVFIVVLYLLYYYLLYCIVLWSLLSNNTDLPNLNFTDENLQQLSIIMNLGNQTIIFGENSSLGCSNAYADIRFVSGWFKFLNFQFLVIWIGACLVLLILGKNEHFEWQEVNFKLR